MHVSTTAAVAAAADSDSTIAALLPVRPTIHETSGLGGDLTVASGVEADCSGNGDSSTATPPNFEESAAATTTASSGVERCHLMTSAVGDDVDGENEEEDEDDVGIEVSLPFKLFLLPNHTYNVRDACMGPVSA